MVQGVPADHYSLIKPDGTSAVGVCDKSSYKIYINKDLKWKQYYEVLCHEITHAAMHSYDVVLSDLEEEFIVNSISNHILNLS